MSILSEFLASFPNNSVTIQRFTETTNEIGEKTKAWNDIFTNVKCIFQLSKQKGDEQTFSEKTKVVADYECRVELEDIGETTGINEITTITEKDRIVIGTTTYKILFVHGELGDVQLIDHCNLFVKKYD